MDENEKNEQEREDDSFFNEKSPKWLGKFKNWTIFLFFVLMLSGFVAGIVIAYNEEKIIPLLAYTAGGIVCANFQLVVNMLIIQLLNNVQIIREKLEEK